MKKFIYSLLIIILFLSINACKPTEKGYKSAYDAALNKRESVNASFEVNMDGKVLEQVDGPQLKEIDGIKVYVENQRLRPVSHFEILPGNYNVAVSIYKMSTNANSQVQDLRETGLDAFVAKDTDDRFYTIAGSYDSMAEALKLYKTLQKDKQRIYVGFPQAPVIIYSPKR